jgi:hypothetical protein
MQAITSFVKRYPQPVFWAIEAARFYGFHCVFSQLHRNCTRTRKGDSQCPAVAWGPGSGRQEPCPRVVRTFSARVCYLAPAFGGRTLVPHGSRHQRRSSRSSEVTG